MAESSEIAAFEDNNPSPSNQDMDDSSTLDDDKEAPGYDSWTYVVGPALQVLSLSVFNPHHSNSHYIYGDISVTDYIKNKYYIYHCSSKEDELDLLKPGWNSLKLPPAPIAQVMGGYVNFQLHKDDGVPIFDNQYDMNKGIENSEERTFTLEHDGFCGYRFKMDFTKFPFSVMASVEMFLHAPPPPNPDTEFYKFHGKITTNKVVCFETKPDEPLKGKYGTRTIIPIHRDVYAVPVDSSLMVDMELYSGALLLSERKHKLDSLVGNDYLVSKCEVDGYDFIIQVRWMIPRRFYAYDMLSSAAFPPKSLGPAGSCSLVEVFSVYFGGGNSSAPRDIDIYGTIVVGLEDGEGFNILAGSKDSADKLLLSEYNEFRTLSLKWPDDMWVDGDNFDMVLNLMDVDKNPICKGLLSWMPGNDRRCDIRLCDVFECQKDYFVGVHYSVFANGKKAKVSIECTNGHYSIYGSMFAKYNNQDYSSTYDEQCYRSILFKRSREDAIDISSSQIPLLKSQVSTPSECTEVIVCGDLWLRPFGKNCPHNLYHFDTSDGKIWNFGWGSLAVKVVWV